MGFSDLFHRKGPRVDYEYKSQSDQDRAACQLADEYNYHGRPLPACCSSGTQFKAFDKKGFMHSLIVGEDGRVRVDWEEDARMERFVKGRGGKIRVLEGDRVVPPALSPKESLALNPRSMMPLSRSRPGTASSPLYREKLGPDPDTSRRSFSSRRHSFRGLSRSQQEYVAAQDKSLPKVVTRWSHASHRSQQDCDFSGSAPDFTPPVASSRESSRYQLPDIATSFDQHTRPPSSSRQHSVPHNKKSYQEKHFSSPNAESARQSAKASEPYLSEHQVPKHPYGKVLPINSRNAPQPQRPSPASHHSLAQHYDSRHHQDRVARRAFEDTHRSTQPRVAQQSPTKDQDRRHHREQIMPSIDEVLHQSSRPPPPQTSTRISKQGHVSQQQPPRHTYSVGDRRPSYRHVEPTPYRHVDPAPHRHVDSRQSGHDSRHANGIESRLENRQTAPTGINKDIPRRSEGHFPRPSPRYTNYQPPNVRSVSTERYSSPPQRSDGDFSATNARYTNYQPPDVRSVSSEGFDARATNLRGHSRDGKFWSPSVGSVSQERNPERAGRGEGYFSGHLRHTNYKPPDVRSVSTESYDQ